MSAPRVAIFLFPEVEVLDFAGPFEVFSCAGRPRNDPRFDVFTVAESPGPVIARNGLSINPTHHFGDCPPPDLVVIGFGTRPLMHHAPVIDWIRERSSAAELTMSVCTGSLLLARAGLLDGLTATTHRLALDLLRQTAPAAEVRANARFIDSGRIITSAGISAGIDMSLHIVERLCGREIAEETARYMEYEIR